MRRQRNTPSERTEKILPLKNVNEMEASNPPDKEFKTMVIKMSK